MHRSCKMFTNDQPSRLRADYLAGGSALRSKGWACVHIQITPGILVFLYCFFFPPPSYPPTAINVALSYSSCVTCTGYNRCTFQKVTPLIGDALNIRSSETGRQKAQCLNCRLPLCDCMVCQAWSNTRSYENPLRRMWYAWAHRDTDEVCN